MDLKEMIHEAERVINGIEAKKDSIRPDEHAKALDAEAPAMAVLLRDSAVMKKAEQRATHAKDARLNQNSFYCTAMAASGAILFTAFLAASVSAVGILEEQIQEWFGATAHDVFLVLTCCSIAAAAVAAMLLNRLRSGGLLDDWIEERSAAERGRLEYFDAVMTTEADAESEIPIPLLKLEYVRRFLLDSQIAYFETNKEKHAGKARRRQWWKLGVAAAAAIATTISGVLAASNGTEWSAIATLGVAIAAIASLLATNETIYQDSANAKRYKTTLHRLLKNSEQLTTIRKAVAGGDTAALTDFFNSVRGTLATEHEQWTDEARKREETIAELRAELAKHTRDGAGRTEDDEHGTGGGPPSHPPVAAGDTE